jgi:quinol monooxygenase YgiN
VTVDASRTLEAMVHVVAVITALPGKREALLAAFNENVPAVHAEEGCIEYGAAVDAEGFGSFQAPLGPDTFAVIEKWASADALKAHGRSPHMVAYAAKSKELIAQRAIHILSAA